MIAIQIVPRYLKTKVGAYAIVDGFSEWTPLIALKTESALELTNAILSRWISIFKPPEKYHSDRGTNFTSKHFQDMCNEYGIRKTFSSPYYPMGNSIVERQFKTIKIFCFALVMKMEQTESNLYGKTNKL